MDRFLQLSLVTFVIAASMMTTTVAKADGRITAGAVIPLDPAKAADASVVSEIVSSCFYEETMKGMFPELAGIESMPGTSRAFSDLSSQDAQRTTAGAITTATTTWTAAFDSSLTFDERVASGGLEQKYLRLSLDDSYDLTAYVDTNFKDLELSDRFTLPHHLALVQVVSTREKTCGRNNWGRDRCTMTEPVISAVNLVVPANFVAAANWTNEGTRVETAKRFDYFNYADCVLWKWEH